MHPLMNLATEILIRGENSIDCMEYFNCLLAKHLQRLETRDTVSGRLVTDVIGPFVRPGFFVERQDVVGIVEKLYHVSDGGEVGVQPFVLTGEVFWKCEKGVWFRHAGLDTKILGEFWCSDCIMMIVFDIGIAFALLQF